MSGRPTRTGGSTSKVVQSYGCQVGVTIWLGASVSLHVGLSMGLLECPHVLVNFFSSRKSDPTDHGRSCNAFYDFCRSHVFSLYSVGCTGPGLIHCWRVLREQELPGVILGAGNIPDSFCIFSVAARKF